VPQCNSTVTPTTPFGQSLSNDLFRLLWCAFGVALVTLTGNSRNRSGPINNRHTHTPKRPTDPRGSHFYYRPALCLRHGRHLPAMTIDDLAGRLKLFLSFYQYHEPYLRCKRPPLAVCLSPATRPPTMNGRLSLNSGRQCYLPYRTLPGTLQHISNGRG
jgi:hypothetical protein